MVIKNIINEDRITIAQINASRSLWPLDLVVELMRADGTIVASCILNVTNLETARPRKYVAVSPDGTIIDDTYI